MTHFGDYNTIYLEVLGLHATRGRSMRLHKLWHDECIVVKEEYTKHKYIKIAFILFYDIFIKLLSLWALGEKIIPTSFICLNSNTKCWLRQSVIFLSYINLKVMHFCWDFKTKTKF